MGISEAVIGTWLATCKPQVTIATKASVVMETPRRIDNSESHLRAKLETSLRRLGRDHVDLFYIHRREPARPLDEVIGTLSRLIEAGKIGGYGMSEVAPDTMGPPTRSHIKLAAADPWPPWPNARPETNSGDNYLDEHRYGGHQLLAVERYC